MNLDDLELRDPKVLHAELVRLGMQACDRVLGATGQREALEAAMRERMSQIATAIGIEITLARGEAVADDLADLDDEREREQWRSPTRAT